MTNREYIETLSNEKLADFLSGNTDCEACPIKDYCHNDDFQFLCYRVWQRWLENDKGEMVQNGKVTLVKYAIILKDLGE